MHIVPDVVGYKLDSALHILNGYDFEIIVKETFGNKETNYKEARVIKQTASDNTFKLIISYF